MYFYWKSAVYNIKDVGCILYSYILEHTAPGPLDNFEIAEE